MGEVLAWRQMVTDFEHVSKQGLPMTQTLRLKSALAGTAVRFQLAADFDAQPIVVQSLTVNQLPVTVAGKQTYTVPAHQRIWTDWVTLSVAVAQWLVVTMQVDHPAIRTLMSTKDTTWIQPEQPYFLGPCAMQVRSNTAVKQLVCFGDSLTNQGYYSAAFMQQVTRYQPNQWGLTNGGISGNRLLRDAHSTSPWAASFGNAGLTRLAQLFDSQPVDRLIFMMGLNDLLHPGTGSPMAELPTATELINGLQQVQQLAAKYQVKLWLLTITPFKGAVINGVPAWTVAKEQIRQAVNQWIVTQPDIIDVATHVAAQHDDAKLAIPYDCGDHTHFSASGGEQLGCWLYQQIQPML
ncbi:GDSL-type esterase/lipase family protein [Lactiplantibacillus daowaiensis]|uniref:GDSL-type esterase/lipase family protein n=1 Tax=Lactiplantibacillus daowaiensis TaxID=2559918 RepID=A0ABW1S192_9LACO|nr:GDSL-type esterase/lipase family protein [Lactiplantibacillus daowaiensis]